MQGWLQGGPTGGASGIMNCGRGISLFASDGLAGPLGSGKVPADFVTKVVSYSSVPPELHLHLQYLPCSSP